MSLPRRRFLGLVVTGLAAIPVAACAAAPSASPSPAATTPPSKPASLPTEPVATAAAKPTPVSTAPPKPTAAPVLAKPEQATGKLVLVTGLFDNVFSRMGEEKGFFKDAGINLEYVEISQGPAIQSALFNGEVDFAEIGTTLMTVPIEKGVPVKVVAVPKPRQNLLFYSRKEINSLPDLYGKTIGTGAPGAPVYVTVQALFDKYGADLGKAELTNLGTSSAVGQGLLAGKIDAGPAGVELLPQIESSGDLKVLYNLAAEVPDFIRVVVGATDRTIQERPNFVAAFLAAYAKGIRYTLDHRDEGIALANKLFPGKPKDVESSFDWYVQNKIVNPNLDFSSEDFGRFQQLMVKLGLQAKPLPYEQVVDLAAQKKAIAALGSYTYRS